MSLINDALKRARVEALRQEEARGGTDYRALPAHSRRDSRALARLLPWVVSGAAILLALWLGLRAPRGGEIAGEGAAGDGRAGESAAGAEPAAASGPVEPAVVGPSEPGTTPRIATDETPAPSASSRSEEAAAGLADPVPEREPRSGDRQRASGTESTPSRDEGSASEGPVAAPPAATSPGSTSERIEPGRTYLRRVAAADGSVVTLGGIAYSQERPIAVINGAVVTPGDLIAGFTVIAIEPERVELEADGVRFHLTLH